MPRLMSILFTASVFVTTCGVSAASAQKFSGAHVDALAGWSSGGSDRSSRNGPDGLVYGVGLGYDARRGDAVLGLVAEIAGVTGDGCLLVDYPAQGTGGPAVRGTACGRERRTLVGGLRAGYVAGADTLLYVTVGYANKRIADRFVGTIDGRAVDFSGARNRDGVRAGAGIERALGERLSLRAEYRYTAFGHDLASDQHQVVAGVGFHF